VALFRRPLAGRLVFLPELKVLGPVVVADAVLVVDVLALDEWATEDLLHDQTMFVHVVVLVPGGVVSGPHLDIALSGMAPTALPVLVVRPSTCAP
jgi:hypothetical protein